MLLISALDGSINEVVIGILFVLILLGSVILSAVLNSRKKIIEIKDGTIIIDKSRIIILNQIDTYVIGKSFLIDGLTIKMKNGKKYYFHALAFLSNNPNFQLFKDILFNKSVDNNIIPIKTKQDILRESKFLRYGSTIILIFLVVSPLLSYLTDIKFDTLSFVSWTLIALGIFISTRK